MIRMNRITGPALLALAAMLAACEGDNLFVGPGTTTQTPPVVTSIQAPFSADAGSVVDFRVRAVAPRGMAAVTLRYRHALVAQEEHTFNGMTDTVTVDATVQMPVLPQDSILVIEAFATDVGGRVSPIISDTIRVNITVPGPISALERDSRADARRPLRHHTAAWLVARRTVPGREALADGA